MANHIQIGITSSPSPSFTEPMSLDEQIQQTITHWDKTLAPLWADQPDLILLPENCDRWHNQSIESLYAFYRYRGKAICEHFQNRSRTHQCMVIYPHTRQDQAGNWHNSAMILDRGEVIGCYDKCKLTPREIDRGFEPGCSPGIIDTRLGRLGLITCFDLNFLDLMNLYAQANLDLPIFTSMYHGGLMQPFWAYQCRCPLASSISGLSSGIPLPTGECIAQTTNYQNYISANINLDRVLVHLDFNDTKLKQLKTRYGRKVHIHDPGHLGAVAITSDHEHVSAREMIDELAIEDLDQYLKRASEMSCQHSQMQL